MACSRPRSRPARGSRRARRSRSRSRLRSAAATAPVELALACQKAEHLATGVPSGVMDQLASVAARAGHALLIDCRSLELRHVRMPDEAAIVVVHSGVPRTLERSAYSERRAACERIATVLGLGSLRDATLDQVLDEPLARHVVTENARVEQTAAALEIGTSDASGSSCWRATRASATTTASRRRSWTYSSNSSCPREHTAHA